MAPMSRVEIPSFQRSHVAIETDMSATTIERFLLAPAMSNAPRQIGDLCHEDLIFGTPRYEDLKASHQSDFPSNS